MNPLLFYVVASYLTAGVLWSHLGGSWKKRLGLFVIAPLICPALLWVEFVALVVDWGFKNKELPPKQSEQPPIPPSQILTNLQSELQPELCKLCPIPEAMGEPPIPSDPPPCQRARHCLDIDPDNSPYQNTHQETADILNQAADLLEHNTRWGQGGFYQFDDQGCTMDAHGAIAYCGDAKIRAEVLAGNKPEPHAVAPVCIVRTAGRFYTDFAKEQGLDVLQYMSKYYGGAVGAAHYQAAKVGLDFAFNDAKGRTKEEIIAKLREASVAATKETTQ